MGSQPQYLIRMCRGQRAMVCPMRYPNRPRSWFFGNGVAVICDSRSDGLKKAQQMMDRLLKGTR